MESFKSLIGVTAYGIEAFGVLIILIGTAVASVRFVSRLSREPMRDNYSSYRLTVGRAIILGLEFLIAGDVVRTVIVSHTLADVAVLGLIVVVRAFLSFTLALEIEGRWPWQTAAGKGESH